MELPADGVPEPGANRLWPEQAPADPPEPADPLRRGQQLIAIGKPAAAIEPLRQAVHAAPDDPEAMAELGIARKLSGYPEGARRCLETALGRCDGPLAERVAFILALTLDDLGRREQAIATFEALSLKVPPSPLADVARYYANSYRS